MELNVTPIIEEHDPTEFSDSVHNSGLDNIGEITWRRALAFANESEICRSPEELSAAEDYIKSTGGWGSDEVEAMEHDELRALVVQFVASAYNELENGGEPCSLYQGDDGQWYFYLGC
jgi:hypothetical protein